MRVGSLFTGCGGLDLGVADALDGEVVWVADNAPAASTVLAARYDVPNLGDLHRVDWSRVEPVDVLVGGFPCQDLSIAGNRKGIRPGTRSGLWAFMAYAILVLRPRLVVIENVPGILRQSAASNMEPCPVCLGDTPDRAMRALGAVLGDLAELGCDAIWQGVRASDVGAPHLRLREFILAWDQRDPAIVAAARGPARARPTGLGEGRLFATPQASDGRGVPGDNYNLANLVRDVALLPTPAVNDMGEGKSLDWWDEWTDRMRETHDNGNGHGRSLAIEVERLLPTPTTQDSANNGGPAQTRRKTRPLNAVDVWGDYAPAITRWETLTRPAPPPKVASPDGPKLSPRFVEWMMGLPAGWVTDVDGVSRRQALEILGNAVIPAQAAHAVRLLLDAAREEIAA